MEIGLLVLPTYVVEMIAWPLWRWHSSFHIVPGHEQLGGAHYGRSGWVGSTWCCWMFGGRRRAGFWLLWDPSSTSSCLHVCSSLRSSCRPYDRIPLQTKWISKNSTDPRLPGVNQVKWLLVSMRSGVNSSETVAPCSCTQATRHSPTLGS